MGRRVAADGAGVQSRDRSSGRPGAACLRGRRARGRHRGAQRLRRMATGVAHQAGVGAVRLPRTGQCAQGRSRPPHHRPTRQGARRRVGRGGTRLGGRRLRVRPAASAEGRLQRAGLDRRRRVLDSSTRRRMRGHHPVQLPRHGAHVDVPGGCRVRQRVHPQAVGARSRRVDPVGRAVGRSRSPLRCVHGRARRQGGRRRARSHIRKSTR